MTCTNLMYVLDDVIMSEGLYRWVRGKLPSYLDVIQQELRDFYISEYMSDKCSLSITTDKIGNSLIKPVSFPSSEK